MKLYSIKNCPASEGENIVCRVSSVGSFIGFVITASLSLGLFVFDFVWVDHTIDAPTFVVTYCAIVIGLLSLLFLFHLRKSRRPSNWLMQLGDHQVRVKYRSYLNDHLPEEDLIIAEIPSSEIAWARKTKEKVVVMSSTDEGPVNQVFTYLDLKLNSPETETLRQALLDERNRRPPIEKLNHDLFEARKRKAPDSEIELIKTEIKREGQLHPRSGSRFSTGIHHHYPVRMLDDAILRLDWSFIRPRISKILQAFEKRIPIEPIAQLSEDFTETTGNMEDRILDLAARGNKLDAIALARKHYDYSLAEAKAFVESLLKNEG